VLAVAIAAWLLIAAEGSVGGLESPREVVRGGVETSTAVQDPPAPPQDTTRTGAQVPDTTAADTVAVDLERSTEEAASTVLQLWRSFAALLPKILIAVGLLLLAGLLSAIVRPLLRRLLGSWARGAAAAALAGVVIWLLAISVALSVIAGDPRTLLGSAGLIGLGLSWALQQPIESFTAWLLNSFRGYYRVGDRIAVGDVFGDVYRIDFLTTTVWEAGGPHKPVQGAQPTGALVTVPNSEVLRANVVNYTRDFPYVWDEVDVGLTNESDLDYAQAVLLRLAADVVGEKMKRPIAIYRDMLERASLTYDIADQPQVFFSSGSSWTSATIRYLVDARQRRSAASDLTLAIAREFSREEHRGRMALSYPTERVLWTSPEGRMPS
jgi:small-conductance mechanosensitive channel